MRPEPARNKASAGAIRRQVEKIVSSEPFARSERMRRFLQYVVEKKLDGEAESLKEYSIALNVYDKTAAFDPRLDPIIRVEAGRLRTKLREYYDTHGFDDPIVISLPKRSYKPQWRFAAAAPAKTTGRSTTESNAQRLYLKGRHYWNKQNPAALAKAMECFNAAITEKPDFALALAGLGDCYATLAWLESMAPAEAWPRAIETAQGSLHINSRLAQAHTTVGCEKALHQFSWQEAENSFRDAISMDDRYATAHHWHGMFCLAPQRRLEEAFAELKEAHELDPASAIISCHLARILYFRRRYDEAISQLHHSIKLDPTLHLAYWHLGFVYAQVSEPDRATAAFAEAYELSDDPMTVSGLGYIYAVVGNRARVDEARARLDEFGHSRYVSPIDLALVDVASGNLDLSFNQLQRAINERAPRVVHLKVEPVFDSIKTDNRFLDLLKNLNV